MANIDTYLEQIKTAVYGEEVRGAIHDSISEMNTELKGVSYTCSSAEYELLPIEEKNKGIVFYLYDTKQIVRNNVIYGSSTSEIVDTINGSIVRFDTSDGLLKNFEIELKPIQNDRGFGGVWLAGRGVNQFLLDETPNEAGEPEIVVNGVTITYDQDIRGRLWLNGTCTRSSKFTLNSQHPFSKTWNGFFVARDRFVKSGSPIQTLKYEVQTVNASTGTVISTDVVDDEGYGGLQTISYSVGENIFIRVQLESGKTYDNVLLEPMIYLDSNDPTKWTPFNNRCPVQRNVDVYVYKCRVNIFDKNGVTRTDGKILNWIGDEVISNEYGYFKDIPIAPGKNYILSGLSIPSGREIYIYQFDKNKELINVSDPITADDFTSGYTLYHASDKAYYLGFSYVTFYVDTDKIQLELGTTPTEYSEYDKTETLIHLDNPVFGGTFNVLSGIIKSDWVLIASYNGEELPGIWLSDRDNYTPGTTPSIGAQVVYKNTSYEVVENAPVTYTVNSGINTIWVNQYPIFLISYYGSEWKGIAKTYELKSSDYENLPDEDKTNSTIYFLNDTGKIMFNDVEYGGGGGSTFKALGISERVQSSSTITTTIEATGEVV